MRKSRLDMRNVRAAIERIKDEEQAQQLTDEEEQQLWQRIENANRMYDSRSIRLLWRTVAAAASVALLVGVARYAVKKAPTQLPEPDYLTLIADNGADDDGKVQLTLADSEVITIEGKETVVEYATDGTVHITGSDSNAIAKTARAESTVAALNRLKVPQGKRATLTLPDGTKVWVNSGSQVVYPDAFEPKKREIFVDGEAYLDVAHDADRPFTVKTNDLSVTVTGTQFDVRSYRNDADVCVALVEGSVSVAKNADKAVTQLRPNQIYTYNTATQEARAEEADLSEFVAWKDCYYQFSSRTMDVVLNKLVEYYGVNIMWSSNLNLLVCSGKLDMKEDLQEVLNALEKAAPVSVSKNDDGYFIEYKENN